MQAELRARIDTLSQLTAAKSTELSERAVALRSKIKALQAGLDLQTQTIADLVVQFDGARMLATSGSISTSELQRREGELRDACIAAQSLAVNLADDEVVLAALRGERAQTPMSGNLRELELKQSIHEIEQRIASAEGRLAYQVTAPSDGIIDTILVVPGQTVAAASLLISLRPESSLLVAELYVPSRAIAFVEPKQSVRLAYDSFPFMRFGRAEGTISTVSETILRPDEIADKPLAVREPSYRVVVPIARQTMRAAGKDIPLRPGLTFDADVILDRRTLAQWILLSVQSIWARE